MSQDNPKSEEHGTVEDVIVLFTCSHWLTDAEAAASFFLGLQRAGETPRCLMCKPANEEAKVLFVGRRSVDRIWIEEKP